MPLRDVVRAITDGEEEGFVKIHARDGADRILGAIEGLSPRHGRTAKPTTSGSVSNAGLS